MGYYVKIDGVEWTINETPKALETIREMPTKYHSIKRGGSSNGEKWFSWIGNEDIENAESVEAVFKRLGFETQSEDDGFQIIGYDSKTGQEDLFLGVMAPFTAAGSYMNWIGEDGAQFRFEIRDGVMWKAEAQIKWSDWERYSYHHISLDPRTNKFRYLDVDPYSPFEEPTLEAAQKWQDDEQAYWEELREKNKETSSL